MIYFGSILDPYFGSILDLFVQSGSPCFWQNLVNGTGIRSRISMETSVMVDIYHDISLLEVPIGIITRILWKLGEFYVNSMDLTVDIYIYIYLHLFIYLSIYLSIYTYVYISF